MKPKKSQFPKAQDDTDILFDQQSQTQKYFFIADVKQ